MVNLFNDYAPLIISMILGALLGISLYLPLMTGQLSLASPGFYAVGGYVAAIFSTKIFLTSGLYPWYLLLMTRLGVKQHQHLYAVLLFYNLF